MSDLFVRVLNSSFADAAGFPEGVSLIVEEVSHEADGGPKDARIKALGSVESLRELVRWLGTPLEIYDLDTAWPCWWGRFFEISIVAEGVKSTYSLENVYNKVAVSYSAQTPGTESTEQKTTDWTTDADSIAQYGTRELLYMASDVSDDAATNLRDGLLEDYAWPEEDQVQAAGNVLEAEIYCTGWWGSLQCQYVNIDAAGDSYVVTDLTVHDKQKFGDVTAYTKVAQSFTPSSQTGITHTWYAANIRVYLQKVLSPSDGVKLSICQDNSGVPGAEIESVTIDAADISLQLIWVEEALTEANGLAVSTTYWLVAERTGALDASNYYFIGCAEAAGYSGGVFRIWNGAAWVVRSPDADMVFVVGGTQITSDQIDQVVVAASEYLTGADIEDASGIKSTTYRAGDDTAVDAIQALQELKTSTKKRILCDVTWQRRLRIRARPDFDPDALAFFIDTEGRVVDRQGNPAPPHSIPAGQWIGLLGYQETMETGRNQAIGRMFVERAEYSPDRGWRVEKENPFGIIARIEDG